MAKKIIVIDDEPEISEGISEYLNSLGYEAFPAFTADQGLALARRSSPQMFIVDLGLPGVDGFELIQKINQEFVSVPIVILTGSQNDEHLKRAFDMGVCEFIAKPISLEALSSKIIHRIIGGPFD